MTRATAATPDTASAAVVATTTPATRHANPVPSAPQPLRFVRRGQIVSCHDVPPERTLLELLRDDLGCTGTKEGCGEGDCGACTVVLAEADATGSLRYRAINSCIRLAHSIDGMALWTVEDIAADRPGFCPPADSTGAPAPAACDEAELHPVQQAMVQCHASQCGFCTPGFVMSLFGQYQQARSGQPQAAAPALSRHEAQLALSGNLCRCTGYRPILDAAQAMATLPPQDVDEALLRQRLAELAAQRPDAVLPPTDAAQPAYLRPRTLASLLAWRAARPQAQLVAGATDVGLWITKQHRRFGQMLDVTGCAELTVLQREPGADGRAELRIGAAVALEDAFAELRRLWPELDTFTRRFAGLPVRHSGTLGGNVANGSPIGDSMPLLIALRAEITLASVRGQRRLPLEALYTGYRQNLMAGDEILAWIHVPLPGAATSTSTSTATSTVTATGATTPPPVWLAAYKISKRYDDDISAVCLVLQVQLDGQGCIAKASLGAGGVAATPARARLTEAALRGQPWREATVRAAMAVLRQEFSPISDMRASGDYRRVVLGNLLWRFWLEHPLGAAAARVAIPIRLEDSRYRAEPVTPVAPQTGAAA